MISIEELRIITKEAQRIKLENEKQAVYSFFDSEVFAESFRKIAEKGEEHFHIHVPKEYNFNFAKSFFEEKGFVLKNVSGKDFDVCW